MENYQCELCLEKYENPVQCLNCKGKFCSKHVNSYNKCPKCECFPFNYKENTIIDTSTLNFDSKYKCNVCGNGFGEDKNEFLLHIIDEHKDEIINRFNSKSIQNIYINQNINAKKKIIKSINNTNANLLNYSDINQIQNSQQINTKSKNINFPTDRNNYNIKMKKSFNPNQDNSRNMKKSFNPDQDNSRNMKKSSNPPSQNNSRNMNKRFNPPSHENSINNNLKKIYYCGKTNESIECECCLDHICKEGNCLCVNCMKINCDQMKLSKNQLINRAGKVATLYRGNFFCGKEYESIINTVTHRTFRNLKKCQYPCESCNDCKVLTKFRNIYHNFIYL